jgi:hypothetical protein
MARKVSEIGWVSIEDGIKELGKERALAMMKKGTADSEYRDERNKESQEILKAARKDPRFKNIGKRRSVA